MRPHQRPDRVEERAIETDLVVRAKDGDLDAFSTLTATRTNRLYGAARLILRDDGLAEDVVQDALLRAWQDLRGLRDPERFDAWLQRVLVRTCYRAAKRHRLRATLELPADDRREDPRVDIAGSHAIRDQLDRGFRRLTPDQRAVIVLHHYLGLSLVEAAAVLEIPLGTMQSRLSRALQLMRAALEADERATTARDAI
jgi:RNA polymerase sigma-70 factor (ECF subfamily)